MPMMRYDSISTAPLCDPFDHALTASTGGDLPDEEESGGDGGGGSQAP